MADLFTDEMINQIMSDVVDKAVVAFHKLMVISVLNEVVDGSPVRTGFYASHHFVAVGLSVGMLENKPAHTAPGTFVKNIESNKQDQLLKLENLKPYATVLIYNSSAYADDVEKRHSVYQIGSKVGVQNAIALSKR